MAGIVTMIIILACFGFAYLRSCNGHGSYYKEHMRQEALKAARLRESQNDL